ncbi:MAG: penicillin-binding protein 2, partial [Candidatus Helarchaeota archaeon]|nr:penicillin-binding protein 2 [Candidatus Helarchaeota archaeon]
MIQSIRLFDRREWLKDERVEMGKILDRTGKNERNLALSIRIKNRRKRIYPLGKSASHLIGYWDIEKGGAGIEGCYHDFLVGKEFNFLEYFSRDRQKRNDLHLTIDSRLQRDAYTSFGERCGAAVVLIPKTGEVLCLVSSPGFPTNDISDEQAWVNVINNSEDAPMFNRALKGRYPPGSIFKIVTATAAIENNFNKRFYC